MTTTTPQLKKLYYHWLDTVTIAENTGIDDPRFDEKWQAADDAWATYQTAVDIRAERQS